LLDTVNNILSMKVDMVVMRHSASGAPHFLAKHIPAAIINAGDGINEHPTQALLDAFSIKEKIGTLEGKRSRSSAISCTVVSHKVIFISSGKWEQK
jgi:aspartate carbamoyltransferase catalytic subunit